MAEKTYQLRDIGIYQALPVYDPSIKGLTAIVTGANGISGNHMVRVLAQSPKRWEKIYCVSRRPPALVEGLPKNAEYIPLDFLKKPEEIGVVFKEKGVTATHIFFFSYIQVEPKEGGSLWSNAQEMSDVNLKLLSNFLEALPVAGIKPQSILLQTGAKNYGLHLGQTAVPQEESDPRVILEPNFYYAQEDYLWKYCKLHDISWNICMPSFILGAVPDAAMNVCFPLAVYATVTKHLGEKLEYPADLSAFMNPQSQSTCMLNAYQEEWAVLTPGARNQKFNTHDDSMFTWGKFWPKLAALYGVEYEAPDTEGKYIEIENVYKTPPRGYGPNPGYRIKRSLVEWAYRPEVKVAWKELAAKHDLLYKELRDIDRVFAFTDASLTWSQTIYFSTDKARSLGWHGYVNSSDAIIDVFRDFEMIKMLPPVPK